MAKGRATKDVELWIVRGRRKLLVFSECLVKDIVSAKMDYEKGGKTMHKNLQRHSPGWQMMREVHPNLASQIN